MNKSTVLLFTRNGLGEEPASLQQILVEKFLSLTLASNELPAKILFYTNGVRLACEGSPVLTQLKDMQSRGVELIICKTCTDSFGLTAKVQVGIIGGMPDILEALQKAEKVISL
jgi:sulfur relay (sulfurtransferase) complex TusBCD TusD component (DsrE family)